MLEVAEAEGMTCDGAFIYGDMAYKNGPFMSPRFYRQFSQPYHQRLFDAFHDRGMPVIFHSDGDIRPVLPDLIAAGVDAINPMETRAGMDVRELAPAYGDQIGFVGNIDVTVLATNDRDQIRAEMESKIKVAKEKRGYVYHSDHSIPPGVTLETYEYVLGLVDELGAYES
jgi:uroporphyrinogen decarboxylase